MKTQRFVTYAGRCDQGVKQDRNEDYIYVDSKDFGEEAAFFGIADGVGSKKTSFRPGAIVANEAEAILSLAWKKDPELLRGNGARAMMELAFRAANDVLVAFKLGNEEERLGYASTLTCGIMLPDGTFTFGHAGNSRIYVIRHRASADGSDRPPMIKQLTKDHTDGWRMVEEGKLTEDQYYTSVERLSLYNGMGIRSVPEVQLGRVKLKKNDLIVMTTDGVHYAYRPEAFYEIAMGSANLDEAADGIISLAKELAEDPTNYRDNASVIIAWYLGEPEPEPEEGEPEGDAEGGNGDED